MPETNPAPVALACRDEGVGEPILFLHGLGGDHTVWNAVAPALAGDHRVLLPDLRGHGRSPPAPAMRHAELRQDLLALLDAKNLPSANVVGLSGGAFLALELALLHPERVRRLIVIGGGTHCDNHTRAVVDRWAATFRDEGFDAYILRLLKDLVYPDWIEAHMEFMDQLREQQKREDSRAVLAWSAELKSVDLRGRLGRIRSPSLIVHGVDDQVVDAAHGRLLRQSIPGSDLRLFAQTGHLVPVERPAETAAAIRRWLGGGESGYPSGSAPSP